MLGSDAIPATDDSRQSRQTLTRNHAERVAELGHGGGEREEGRQQHNHAAQVVRVVQQVAVGACMKTRVGM